MKVSIYDREGRCIGVAYHEDDVGYVSFPVATEEVVIASFSVNDGVRQNLVPMRMPVDGEFALRIHAVKDGVIKHPPVHNRDGEVDETATTLSWWQRIKQWRPFS